MLVVITAEKGSVSEKSDILLMFDTGLKYLHVRKPGFSEEQMKNWLAEYPPKYRKKMVLHEYYHLAESFALRGIHFTEKVKSEYAADLKEYSDSYRNKGFSVSASFHDPAKVDDLPNLDYVFLSPVFNSISKNGYEGKGFIVNKLKSYVLALGGITSENIKAVKSMGYCGVAVLGGIWQNIDPVENFRKIQKAYHHEFS